MDGWIGMCGESKGFLCVGLVAGLFVCVGKKEKPCLAALKGLYSAISIGAVRELRDLCRRDICNGKLLRCVACKGECHRGQMV